MIFTPLITKHGLSGTRLELKEDLLCALPDGIIILVPRGFTTNLASTPRLVWAIYPPNGRYSYPAVVHDWLYSGGKIICDEKSVAVSRRPTREEADLLFLEMMKLVGCRFYTRWIFYTAVRMFGWMKWQS